MVDIKDIVKNKKLLQKNIRTFIKNEMSNFLFFNECGISSININIIPIKEIGGNKTYEIADVDVEIDIDIGD